MKVPRYGRYDFVNQRVVDFLEEYEIMAFPIEPLEIIAEEKWGIEKYSNLMRKFKCDLRYVERCLQSEDGYVVRDEENYTIAYNDVNKPKGRVRFTLMHEIGHIYLCHLTDFEQTILQRGGLSRRENKVLEDEANAFARNALAPTESIDSLNNPSVFSVAYNFGITQDAAKARLSFYETDKGINTRKLLLPRLSAICYRIHNKKMCYSCNASFVQQHGRHCPICGKKTLKKGDGKMKHRGLFLHENGKLKHCPTCDNEETNIEGSFCQICAGYLLNVCSKTKGDDCESEDFFPGNYRYCPICASPSSFFNLDYLKEWDHKEPEDGFMNIPGLSEIDEELPFN